LANVSATFEKCPSHNEVEEVTSNWTVTGANVFLYAAVEKAGID
jgi:hypothetical protein